MKKFFKKTLIYDWQIGLLYRNGQLIDTKTAGKYWLNLLRDEEMRLYDTRPTTTAFNAGEIQTVDKMGVTVYGSVRRKIVDAKKLVAHSPDNELLIRDWSGEIIKKFVIKSTLDDMLLGTDKLAKELEVILSKRLKGIGVEVVETPVVSILLSRSVKRVLELQTIAKKRALADLEDARGKTAVLRHLKNSAKLVEDNPGLYRLLLSQKVRSLNVALDEKK